jgi:putative aminopeptidase FrvX
MISPAQSQVHREWLKDLTATPTAAGHERRVIRWVKRWVDARADLQLRIDPAGNLLITQRPSRGRRRRTVRKPARDTGKPLLITAHLDHPAFVVRSALDDRTVDLEFRGGVHDPYFDNAVIEVIDQRDRPHRGQITQLDGTTKPFKRVMVRLAKPARTIRPGDVGRWILDGHDRLPRIEKELLLTHACDDLAAAAAALSALDVIRRPGNCPHVGVLLTRAEEIGFIGAIGACKHKSIPKGARLICLENSRSFADSPIGAGPIVRVGDKLSVFEPALTNRISDIMMQHAVAHPAFKWQRKLMPGGTCEATTFCTYGYESTCLCLALGNYHNMQDIDGVLRGRRPAKVGPEFISIDDYHGLIEMLAMCAMHLDSAEAPTLRGRMELLYRDHGFVLKES